MMKMFWICASSEPTKTTETIFVVFVGSPLAYIKNIWTHREVSG